MHKLLKISIFLLLTGLILYKPNLTYSAPTAEVEVLNKEIEARKNKIKQLEETIEKYKKNISEKQTEQVSLKNQMSIIDNRVAQTQADVELTNEKLGKTELQIKQLDMDISEKINTIDKEKLMISQMVQNLHANDQKNFLEIMLTNENLADFFNQAKYLENLYIDLGRSVKQVRLAKEALDVKMSQAEIQKKEFNTLLAQLENKKEDLSDQLNNKQQLLADTKSSELKYKTLLDSLRQQYKVTENEVRSYEDQVRKKLAEQDRFKNLPAAGDADFNWPVSGRYITATFHDPDYPFKKVFEHSGIDIRAPQGSVIRAASSGYIGRARRCTVSTCYSYVLLIHNGNLSTLYGHMSKIVITDEQFVNKGDIIGYTGGTPGTVGAGPFVTGAHLHFEVRANGIPVNPLSYLP